MNRVFISYRREDTAGFARSLFQSLTAYFSSDQIFMDVEDIEPGLDFVDAIDRSLASCTILLVLIGVDWVNCADSEGSRRLDDPNDFVRLEVAGALRRNVRVIPVLVKGAEMPRAEELPEDIRPLTRRQALELRHNHWDADVNRLITVLEKSLVPKRKKHSADSLLMKQPPEIPRASDRQAKEQPPPAKRFPWKKSALVLTALAVLIIIAYIMQLPEDHYTPERTVRPGTVYHSSPPHPVEKSPSDSAYYPEDTFKPSHTMILTAQEWLNQLGYSPGSADGQAGPRTTRAVRAFQRDVGMEPDGHIDEELLGRLEQAISEKIEERRNADAAILNLSGTWQDESDGILYSISQNGNIIYSAGYTVAGIPIGEFKGILNGRVLQYTFRTVAGTAGYGEAIISRDGTYMRYRANDTVTGTQQSGTLHKLAVR